ncbi:alpha/beta hydrolase [Candidatus Viridilinea mediisalina]|uniref:Alpha/beta hydrolase n=1 Tax=Candidatus Viridilinea mediisalina TaxID=2024553 RepID=A0A2A6RNE0_9CHLR|nr:alpha/beta fold hydrolase [Candidatus Viridilinea mediisalina]PDW04582.1 alpha/beta hydrolase [Candidatus Viridilinea mediisalina]
MIRRSALLPSLLSGAIGLVGGALGAAWYVSGRVSPEPRRTFLDAYTFTPWELGVPFEPVRFTSSAGVTLRGWWLPQAEPKGVMIGCHGHSGSKDDMLGIGSNVWRAGYSVLLFDFRGRGESDPWPQTLVSREVDDLTAAVDFVAAREPQAAIGVVGFSMGAAVAILTAAQDARIGAVVADSAFTTGRDVVAHNIRSVLRLPAEFLVMAADQIVHMRHGYRFSSVRPLDRVAQLAPRPLMIIHGAEDTLVPCSHAERLYQAAKEPRELWMVPGVDHCGAYFIDRPAYCQRVIGFLDQYLTSLG